MSFPLSPTNGQTAVLNGITYSYSSANALWTRVTGAVPNTIKSTSSTTPPTNPNIGDIWYNTLTDGTYRYTSDGTSSYWLDFTGPTVISNQVVATQQPTFFAYVATGGQSLTGGTQTKISFSNKNWDTAGAFNTTASPVTLNGLTVPAYSFCPPTAGYYQLTGMIQTTADIKGSIDFCKNGSFDAINGGRTALGQFQGPAGTVVVYLNGVGDYVDLRVYVATTTAVQTQAGANYFQATYLGTGFGSTTIPKASQMPAGSVIQVLQAFKTDTFSTTSISLIDVSGLSITITPTSLFSRFLIMVNMTYLNTFFVGHIALIRNGTEIAMADTAGSRPRNFLLYSNVGNTNADGPWVREGMDYLDSPATTSAITYKIQASARRDNLGGTMYINRTYTDRDTTGYDGRGVSSIVVMEIAG
jgi:hypothetical protein